MDGDWKQQMMAPVGIAAGPRSRSESSFYKMNQQEQTTRSGGKCKTAYIRTIRILIADRFPVVRHGIRHIIDKHPKFEVIAEAGNGMEAVRKAVEGRPDIAILGCALPLLNGIAATAEIRRRTPNTEVLIYTMRANEGTFREALIAGARGYVLKSDGSHRLLAAIEALSLHRPYFTPTISALLLRSIPGWEYRNVVLSERERTIVQWVAEGQTNREIARNLDLSMRTVETYRIAIMRKLSLFSTADVVRYAVRNKIIEP
jgi:DNA-binding NarL/FixJ family response regulator